MDILIRIATNEVIAWGMPHLDDPKDPAYVRVAAPDAWAVTLSQPGIKTINATRDAITLTPALMPPPDPNAAKHTAAITALKAAASGAGAVATLAQNILDLNNIS